MASTIDIFEDPVGEVLETTAGEARANAPDLHAAHQVEVNANLEYQAAGQAASVAKTLGPRYTGEKATSIDKPRNQPENQTEPKLEEAVEEGKRDVASAQAAGSQAIDQIKEVVAKAAGSAQEYLSSAAGQVKGTAMGGAEGGGSAGACVPSLPECATPIVTNTATSALASAKATAQNVLGTAGMQGAQLKDMPASSTGIPATSAPLESGSKKIDSPYPSTTPSVGTKDIGQNEPRTAVN